MPLDQIISLEESRRLVELEEVIERGLSRFIEVGEALTEIKDKRLFEKGSTPYGTFEEYCREEWNMSRTFAYYQIESSKAAKNVHPGEHGGISPTTEKQTRPLTQLPEPAQQQAAWTAAVESAGGEQPTAKQVEAAVKEVIAGTDPEPPKRERVPGPSNGMKYAWQAIESLKMIQRNDIEREEAFSAVLKFIHKNQNQ